MGDSIVPPLQLGFVGEIEKQPMETKAGRSSPTLRKKRPASPLGGDEEPSKSTISDDDDEWLVRDIGGEDGSDYENQGKTLNLPLLT